MVWRNQGKRRYLVISGYIIQNMAQAKILAVANHKGGVGKTTTTATLGAILASRGNSVLLVEF